MEIERKFLINEFPSLEIQKQATIFQSYLSTDPEIRIRSSHDGAKVNYVLCVKSDGDMSREESECEITEDVYWMLMDTIKKTAISKEYVKYKLGDLFLECSLVDRGTSTEFMYAEIEFKTVEDANNFITPEFLGVEVTNEKMFKMKNYWNRTRLHKLN